MRTRALAVVAFSLLSGIAMAQVPEIPFTSKPLLLTFDTALGEVAGVAVNRAQQQVFAYTRGSSLGSSLTPSSAQLLEFRYPSGKFVTQWRRDLYAISFAHSVRVDADGSVWIVDSGSNVVVKLNRFAEVQMVLGRRQPTEAQSGGSASPATAVRGLFRQPTDVAFDSKGNVYVTDGGNARVVKFNAQGEWVDQSSRKTATTNFTMPHSIVVDASDNVYVADSGDPDIAVLDATLKPTATITIGNVVPSTKLPLIPDVAGSGEPKVIAGAPWALCITPGPPQFIFAADAHPGRIYKIDLAARKVIGFLGEAGRQPKQLGWAHALACPSESELYVAELVNWRVQRLDLQAIAKK